MRRARTLLAWSTAQLLLLAAACRGAAETAAAPPFTGSVQLQAPAQVGGIDLPLRSAFFAPATDSNGDPLLLVWLSSDPQTCTALGEGAQPGGARLIKMVGVQAAPGGRPLLPQVGRPMTVVAPGGRAAGATAVAQVRIEALDPFCQPELSEAQAVAVAGNLALLRWDGAQAPLQGALSLTPGALPSGAANLDLRFEAAYCAALAATTTVPPADCRSDDPDSQELSLDGEL